MKKTFLALSLAMCALASTEALAQSAAPARAEYLVCEYDPRQLSLTCWDSSKAAKYRGVPFSQAFDEGWRLMQAYSSGGAHYWLLERGQQAPSN